MDHDEMSVKPMPDEKAPATAAPRPKPLPACLAPAMLQWALQQSPEECARLLGRPLTAEQTIKMSTAPHPPQPSAELIAAYQATCFEVLDHPQIQFRIGQDPAPIERWLGEMKAGQACIITAWNPFSESTDLPENQRRQEQLASALRARGLRFMAAQGRDPSGTWPPEPSLCVLDATLPLVDQLLDDFRQFAAVVVDAVEGCRLRWHPGVGAGQASM